MKITRCLSFSIFWYQLSIKIKIILMLMLKIRTALINSNNNIHIHSKERSQQQQMQKNVIRVRVKTNKFLDMIVAIESDKTIRELAHRVLHCFHELAEQHVAVPPKRRDLTVSAIKIDGFYISKSEIVENLIKDNDEIECEFSKAKPKFPNYPQAYAHSMKQATAKNSIISSKPNERVLHERPMPIITHQVKEMLNSMKESQKNKKQRKKQKKRLKLLAEQENRASFNQISTFKSEELEKNQLQSYAKEKEQKQYQRIGYGFPSNWQDNKNTKEYPKTPTFEIMGSEQQYDQKQTIKQQKQSKLFQNQTIQDQVEPLDTTIDMIKVNKPQSNLSLDAKKQAQKESQSGRPEQGRKKKNISTSILEILSKASEERDKKNKKKEKKLQKIEELKLESNKSIPNSSQNSLNTSLKSINGNKNDKQFVPNNKIASPKVTFHSSPMLSPQRKISNPALQKMDLQGAFDLMNSSKTSKKQVKAEQTSTFSQPASSQQSDQQPKKQPLPTPKIIVEQDSEADSCQASTKAKQQQKPQQNNTISINNYESSTTTSAKLAALNAKISKYKLQFFNDSSDEDENNQK